MRLRRPRSLGWATALIDRAGTPYEPSRPSCRMLRTALRNSSPGGLVLGWLFAGESCWPGQSGDCRQRAAARVPWQVVDIRPPTKGARSWLLRSTWAVPQQQAAR
jgi:hypothetical protein